MNQNYWDILKIERDFLIEGGITGQELRERMEPFFKLFGYKFFTPEELDSLLNESPQ